MTAVFISDEKIQNARDFIFRQMYTEITKGLIDVLSDEKLEIAILDYVHAKTTGKKNKNEIINAFSNGLKAFYYTFSLEMELNVLDIYVNNPGEYTRLGIPRPIFETISTTKKLLPKAIKGYELIGAKMHQSLFKKLQDPMEINWYQYKSLWEQEDMHKLRVAFVRKNKADFVSSDDFQTYTIRDVDVINLPE